MQTIDAMKKNTIAQLREQLVDKEKFILNLHVLNRNNVQEVRNLISINNEFGNHLNKLQNLASFCYEKYNNVCWDDKQDGVEQNY